MAPVRQAPPTAGRDSPVAGHIHSISARSDQLPPKRQSRTVTPAEPHSYLDTTTQSLDIMQTLRESVSTNGNPSTDRDPSQLGPVCSTSGVTTEEDVLKRNLSSGVAICRRSVSGGSVSFAEQMVPPSASQRLAVRDCLASGNAGDEMCANSWRAKPPSHLQSARMRRISKKRGTRAVATPQDAAVHAVPATRMEIVGQDQLQAGSKWSPLRVNTPECSRHRNYCRVKAPLTSATPQQQLSTSLISPNQKSGLEDSTLRMMKTPEVPTRINSPCVLSDDCFATIHDSSIRGVPTTTSCVAIPNTVLSSTRTPTPSTRLVNRDDLIVSANQIHGESSSRVTVDTSNCNDVSMSSSLTSTLHRNFSSEKSSASVTRSRRAVEAVSAPLSPLSHIPTKKKRSFGENPDRGPLSGGMAPISESSRRPTSACRNPGFASVSAMAALVAAVSFVEAAAVVTAAAAEATTAATVEQPPQQHNFTVLVAEVSDDGYDALVADIWVGVVLTLMVLSCVCCVCSCLLYHKFQQWKRSVLAARNGPPREPTEGPYMAGDLESLPSYTIVSGLPSYEEALEQLRLARERRESLKSLPRRGSQASQGGDSPPAAPATPVVPVLVPTSPPPQQNGLKLSVTEFFQMYKSYPPPV